MLKIFGNKTEGFSGSHEETGEYRVLLKPCPFCGDREHLDIGNTHTPLYTVECNNCGGTMVGGVPAGYRGGAIKTARRCVDLHAAAIEKAIAQWNTRTPSQEGQP